MVEVDLGLGLERVAFGISIREVSSFGKAIVHAVIRHELAIAMVFRDDAMAHVIAGEFDDRVDLSVLVILEHAVFVLCGILAGQALVGVGIKAAKAIAGAQFLEELVVDPSGVHADDEPGLSRTHVVLYVAIEADVAIFVLHRVSRLVLAFVVAVVLHPVEWLRIVDAFVETGDVRLGHDDVADVAKRDRVVVIDALIQHAVAIDFPDADGLSVRVLAEFVGASVVVFLVHAIAFAVDEMRGRIEFAELVPHHGDAVGLVFVELEHRLDETEFGIELELPAFAHVVEVPAISLVG